MQLHLKLAVKENISLPIHYNRLVQGAIYNSLDKYTAQRIHEQGFTFEKRTFRLFTFSRLMGRYKFDKEAMRINFNSDLKLIISSPVEVFCTSLLEHFLNNATFRLGTYELDIVGVELKQEIVTEERVILRTLSPVVAYSTLYRADKKKYTCYFQPGEPEFSRIITENLTKKHSLIYKNDAPIEQVSLLPVSQPRLSVLNYKNTVIKGYMCNLRMEGPTSMLQIALDAGLGSKNSQGFGCVATFSGKDR